jgi:membrane-associated phospholipid phosphatase
MAVSYKTYRRIWVFLVLAYFSSGYLIANWINGVRTYYFNVAFSFEDKIPFIPAFIFGYSLDYLSVLLIFFLVTEELRFKKMIKSYLFLTTLHIFFFILIPVKMSMRPVIPVESGFLEELVKFYYWMDAPYNCFPSLHVGYMFLGTLVLWNYKRTWSYIYIVTTLLVSVSVILVKQHYILDVVGAYATSSFVYWICFGLKQKKQQEGSSFSYNQRL